MTFFVTNIANGFARQNIGCLLKVGMRMCGKASLRWISDLQATAASGVCKRSSSLHVSRRRQQIGTRNAAQRDFHAFFVAADVSIV